MSEVTRAELDTVHGRINELRDRVVNLEAQQPHINAALTRIEKSVDRVSAHLSKGVWIVLGLFLVAIWKLVLGGKLPPV